MIVNVSSTAALTAALGVAQGGDTIQLAAGQYSALYISGLNFATDVTITSQNLAAEAVITGLTVDRSSGINFRGLEFVANSAASQTAIIIASSHDIDIDNIRLHGSMDGNPQNDIGGLLVRESANVTVTNSTFEQLQWGISHSNDSNVTISGNTVRDVRSDGILGGGSSNLTISGNSISSLHPMAGDHADAIQIWTANTTTSAHDILIKDNVFMRGSGDVAQGIFLNDEVGNLPYVNVTISGNLVSGGMYNGIYVAAAHGLTISDNIVQGFSPMTSWIYVNRVDDARLINNQVTSLNITTAAQITQSGTTFLPLATDGGAAALQLWTAAHPGWTTGASLAQTGVRLIGTAGADTLIGTGGADTLEGNGGADVMVGGAGNDVYIIKSWTEITEAPGGGIDTVMSDSGSIRLAANIENGTLFGTISAWATGNTMDNVLTGNAGANRLEGLAGNDTISAGARDDTLIGGAGNDDLTGGTGADTFVFARGDGQDVIRDFGLGGEHDALNFSALYALGLTATVTDAANGVTLSFASGDQVFLEGVHAASLHATTSGFIF